MAGSNTPTSASRAAVNPDGTTELVDKYHAQVQLSDAEQELMLREALSTYGWSVDLHRTASGFDATLARGDSERSLHIFLSQLGWANRQPYEHRIQVSRDKFQIYMAALPQVSPRPDRVLLLGYYARQGEVLLAAWQPQVYVGQAQVRSCYINIQTIATAMRDGFAREEDIKVAYTGSNRLYVCCFRKEFIHYYIGNMEELHGGKIATVTPVTLPAGQMRLKRNRIVYGAPGTGKSYRLAADAESYFQGHYTRVTFHSDYTYGEFVGSYKPVPIYRQSSMPLFDRDKLTQLAESMEPLIEYRFDPGPFLRVLQDAILQPDMEVLLLIEEINRADAAAVFGDTFQLLDRDDSGQGEYAIRLSEDAMAYLRSRGITNGTIRLPANMYIWASMNSADQGVMPMDAAFKRRWSFEYLPLEENADVVSSWTIQLRFLPQPVAWNAFRKAINNVLRSTGVPEDRLLGPFFLRASEMNDQNVFQNKLLLYLRDDVLRHNPLVLFTRESFSEILAEYSRGANIFAPAVDLTASAPAPATGVSDAADSMAQGEAGDEDAEVVSESDA